MAAAVAAGGEVVQQAGAVGVVGEEEEAEREFEVHPAVTPPAGGEGDEEAPMPSGVMKRISRRDISSRRRYSADPVSSTCARFT